MKGEISDCRILALLRKLEPGITAKTRVEHMAWNSTAVHMPDPDDPLFKLSLDELANAPVKMSSKMLVVELKKLAWQGERYRYLIRCAYVPRVDAVFVGVARIEEREGYHA